jgi:hypothetical protein
VELILGLADALGLAAKYEDETFDGVAARSRRCFSLL